MIRFARSLAFSTALAGLALGLGGCGGGGGGDTIKIAVCGPMTGDSAAFGEMIKNAAKLKEKEINAAGGVEVGGKMMKVEVVIKDDKGDITQATNVSRGVASDDSISVVIGHFNSRCSNAAKKEYNRAKLPAISPGSTNVQVCAGFPYMFRNLYRDDYQGHQIAQYLKDVLGAKKAAVLFDNDDYGKGLMNSFREKAGEIGLELVEPIDYLAGRTQDYKPLVQKAKDGGADAIFVAGLYNEAALITKSARQDLNMDVPIFGGDGVMSPTFITNAGEASEGAFVATPFLVYPNSGSETEKTFVAAFVADYDKEPDTWAALTYDAMGLALKAIAAAGVDREAIKNHLAAMTSPESAFVGVTGKTYFDAEGDCYSKPVYVATVKGGKFVPAEKQMAK